MKDVKTDTSILGTLVYHIKSFLYSKGFSNPWRDFEIIRRYKKIYPDQVRLYKSNNVIYINPREKRGRALLWLNANKRLIDFWLSAIKINPDIVIDVGLNYGECLFSATYPTNTRIIGIEANNKLLEYIIKSKERHPNREKIEIINAAASDKNGETVFYIDKIWSGHSSIIANDLKNKYVHKVKSIMIDSILGFEFPYKTLLFKIDVEGHEPSVLYGMKHLLDKTKYKLGFVEFDSSNFNSSADINEYLKYLEQYFFVYCYIGEKLLRLSPCNSKSIRKLFDSNVIHTDLVLSSDPTLLKKCGVVVHN